jgi:catechol 2,3-dioxygenase-like lactoylglutathione lyase family enzyme
MGAELNHTVVGAHDKHASARFLAAILGVEVGAEMGPFVPVVLDNSVTLDFMTQADVRPQHYAFLVSDNDFDAAFGRIQQAGLTYWADPHHETPGEINQRWGGRGVYFNDPNGHNMEILTRTP